MYRAARQVLGERKYITIFFSLTVFFLGLFIFIPVVTIPGNTLAFQLSIFQLQDYLLITFLALLVGLNFSMNIYTWKRQRRLAAISKSTASGATAGVSGAFAAVVGSATCASCLAVLFGFMGLGIGSVAFVLKYQIYFLLGAIALVVISLYFTARKVNRICVSRQCSNIDHDAEA